MTITELQLIVTFQVLIWFDWLKLHNVIKLALGYQKWTPKEDMPKFWQWVGCYFCTSFWIGLLNAIVYFAFTLDWFSALLLIASNLIMSRLLDYLLGYQSFKP